MKRVSVLFLMLVLWSVLPAFAADDTASLPVPRFVTVSADEANVRTGPGLRYPIRFILRRDGLPVEVIREFDAWRQIREIGGDEGWVHKSMLSGRRAVIVKGQVQSILKKPDLNAKPIAKLEPGVIAQLEKCESAWCEVNAAGYDGWIEKKDVWGVYPDEIVKE